MRQIFINLPVKDLDASKAFFAALGFSFEPKFTNELAACMVLSDYAFVMLLTEPFMSGFTDKPLVDAHRSTEVINCLSCASKAEVDEMIAKAKAAGATTPRDAQDSGFMYLHGFADLDGHLWELAWMDPQAQPPQD